MIAWAIRIKNIKEYNSLMELLENFEYEWVGGQLPTTFQPLEVKNNVFKNFYILLHQNQKHTYYKVIAGRERNIVKGAYFISYRDFINLM